MTIAERIVRLCQSWTPARLRHWTEAMAREAAEIDRPGPAVLFAVGCAVWAAKVGLMYAFQRALSPDGAETQGEAGMRVEDLWRGRGLALICATGATVLGLVYLSSTGAPLRMLTMNLAALVAGFIVVLPLLGRDQVQRPLAGVLAVAIGLALLLTATLGHEATGARRWISIGGIVLQPSLILLPLLITVFARSRDALTTLGVGLAAVALALQPDRAMAGALVAGLAAVVLVSRDRLGLVCLIASIAGFAATWLRPDVVPAIPFVDRVFRTAFSAGAASGAAVWSGAVLLILPAVVGFVGDRSHRAVHAAFGATWAAIIIAAIVADYPTPLVAYSGSSIVGYILATVCLPRGWRPARLAQRDGVAPAKRPESADSNVAVAAP